MLTVTPSRPADAPHRPGPPPGRGEPPATGAATLALAAMTVASALGFARVFAGHRWVAPVLVTALAGHLAALAARRSRLRPLAAGLVELVVVTLVTIWTVVPSATRVGVPVPGTWRHIGNALNQAGADFASTIAPAPATEGFVLLAAASAGVVALAGDWLAFRRRSPLAAAAPAFVLFVACCALGQPAGREWAVGLEVAAVLAFLLVHRTTVGRHGTTWFADRHGSAAGWAASIGAVAAAAAFVSAVAVTPVVPRAEGTGVLGWRAGPGGSGQRQVGNPIVDLHTRLVDNANTPVFLVRSPVRSDWRLTSLDTFTGEQWVSTDSYRSFHTELPGGQAVPRGTRRVVEQFQVQNLDSVWLPDAFTPVAVSGVDGITYDPVSGSLLTAKPTANGLTYQVTSYEFLATLDTKALEAAPPLTALPSLSRYLQLPPTVPASVKALATAITRGAKTEYDKALALQDYFQSDAFSYSLNPPDDGYGIHALTTFLFRTRTGYCQQFAGAYAVLARAVGLPTRLAVGYAPGTYEGDDTYQVLDADAHTWPEVYFGPKLGWLPFEPTKTFEIPTATGYTGLTAATSDSSTPTPTLASPSTTIANSAALFGALAGQVPGNAGSALPVATPHGNALVWFGIVVGSLAGAVAAWGGLNAVSRRLRWWARRRAARLTPAHVVALRWQELTEVLAWWGIRRWVAESDQELGRRAALDLGRRLYARGAPVPDVQGLARLATEAGFAPAFPPERVDEARRLALAARRQLVRAATWRERLRWVFTPSFGWQRATVEPVHTRHDRWVTATSWRR